MANGVRSGLCQVGARVGNSLRPVNFSDRLVYYKQPPDFRRFPSNFALTRGKEVSAE